MWKGLLKKKSGETTVGEMNVGDDGYVNPWQVRQTPDGQDWMFAETVVRPESMGVCTARIQKTENNHSVWVGDRTAKPTIVPVRRNKKRRW